MIGDNSASCGDSGRHGRAVRRGSGFCSERSWPCRWTTRIERVRECLPGAGCGACGFTGCDSYAAAVVNDGAPVNCCPVGGAKVAKAIGEIMGVDAGDSVRMVATVLCQGDKDHCKIKYEYEGLMECRAMFLASGGDKACKYACLGLGCLRKGLRVRCDHDYGPSGAH